jgi:hypothetical protein
MMFIRETLRALYAALIAITLTGGGLVLASGGGSGAATVLSGLVTGDRLTLTSTSGIALTANGQGAGAGLVVAGGSSNANAITATQAGSGVVGSFTGTTASTRGIEVTTTNGAGASISTTGTGISLILTGDATSPTAGHLRLNVLDTNPTSCAVGDLFMFTGGVLRVCTATTPTWVNVGAQ